MANENKAIVLTEKVAQGWRKETEALEIAKTLLATKTARLFQGRPDEYGGPQVRGRPPGRHR